ncbi:hypothetical protein QJS04_geneDACA011500 [Acorus gramineus]|uniref:Coiled-coil domain-containing protein 47 n=1 Tax=Acorus gramineus TaxID=55184 RepID=A0AAV9A2U5_ACOGR|nr:hypothetical protein QJS04_geneDACA011500 [Acorus gramineus]
MDKNLHLPLKFLIFISYSASPISIMASKQRVVLLLLALTLFLSSSIISADFEGFDSDEAEDDEQYPSESPEFTTPPPTLTTTTTPSDRSPDASPPSDLRPNPSSPLDFWDEDEFEGITPTDAAPSPPSDDDPLVEENPQPSVPLRSSRSYTVEIASVTFLIAFTANYFVGKRNNEAIALAWASRFAIKGSIFEKNFSLLGTGDGKDTPLLLKEGQDVFKFYASGRRYCQGLLATMELRTRHDLISSVYTAIVPGGLMDTISFEVWMNDDAMDHVILAVARKKTARVVQKECQDLQRYANAVSGPPSWVKRWVAEDLVVVAESREVAGDLLSDAVLDQVFGDKAFERFGKGFISMHFSDQHPGSHRKVLLFKFALPDANNMADMTRLVGLIPYYIDLVGRYKLSSQARSKTEAARAKAAQEAQREYVNARQEALQKKKAEKKKLMEEAEAKSNAEAIRKREEKERARQMKKAMPRVKMLRSH